MPPHGGEKKWGQIYGEENRDICTVGVVNLVVLACVLRATTKKVVNLFGEEKCTPEKILATPMSWDERPQTDL